MKRRILFVCNTPFQIIVALTLKYGEFKNDIIDIIISDHMNDSLTLFNKIKDSKIFDNVLYVKSSNYTRKKENIIENKIDLLKYLISPGYYLNKYIEINERYDIILGANIERFFALLVYTLSKKNKNLKVRIFEDGYISYTKLMESYIDWVNVSQKISIIEKLVSRKNVCKCLDGIYLFEPELICWSPKFNIYGIDKRIVNNKEYIKNLNFIFNYENLKDDYDKKVIFFEESFFAEDINIGDIEIVDEIAKIIGKENIIIKIHPRNKINRFKEQGFCTNINTSIPWEVIALNSNLEKTTLITISSSAVLTPRMILNQQIKTILLYKATEKKSPYIDESCEKYLKRLKKLKGDNLYICDRIEELSKIIGDEDK